MKQKISEPVTTICYGQKKEWHEREEAIRFFKEGILSTDGSERERYVNIVSDLEAGKKIAVDTLPQRVLNFV